MYTYKSLKQRNIDIRIDIDIDIHMHIDMNKTIHGDEINVREVKRNKKSQQQSLTFNLFSGVFACATKSRCR